MSGDLQRRFGRQIRLADIGDGGQAKLCAAEVALESAGFARTIEERYLEAAGVRVRPGSSSTPRDLTALGLRHAPAREVAEGALEALIAIRRVLGVGS